MSRLPPLTLRFGVATGLPRSSRAAVFGFLSLLATTSTALAQSGTSLLDSYDFSPDAGIEEKLPNVLAEVSGLATTPDGRLFAHNDERATIFEVDPASGELIKAFSVGLTGIPGDFEGIAISGERFFLSTSDGQILEFREGTAGSTVRYRAYDLGLGNLCEMEGLAVDEVGDALLLPCKTPRRKDLKDHLVVLSVSLTSMKLDPRPLIAIPLEDLDVRGLGDKFHPSSIEVHPQSRSLILVAAREEALVELSFSGEILGIRELKRKKHPQPEGLAFLPDGSLILADEGQGKKGTLTRYARINGGGGGIP
jgi:uncharacterized protein YjiK